MRKYQVKDINHSILHETNDIEEARAVMEAHPHSHIQYSPEAMREYAEQNSDRPTPGSSKNYTPNFMQGITSDTPPRLSRLHRVYQLESRYLLKGANAIPGTFTVIYVGPSGVRETEPEFPTLEAAVARCDQLVKKGRTVLQIQSLNKA